MYETRNGNHALAVARTLLDNDIAVQVNVSARRGTPIYSLSINGHAVQMSPEPVEHELTVGARLRSYGMPEATPLSEGWM